MSVAPCRLRSPRRISWPPIKIARRCAFRPTRVCLQRVRPSLKAEGLVRSGKWIRFPRCSARTDGKVWPPACNPRAADQGRTSNRGRAWPLVRLPIEVHEIAIPVYGGARRPGRNSRSDKSTFALPLQARKGTVLCVHVNSDFATGYVDSISPAAGDFFFYAWAEEGTQAASQPRSCYLWFILGKAGDCCLTLLHARMERKCC
jgi:hypothetical protein